jgi:predicted HicB family RNase H-like nuclease
MSNAKQKVFMVRADSSQHNRLKVLAARMDIGMSDLIREAVDAVLAKHEPQFEKHNASGQSHAA